MMQELAVALSSCWVRSSVDGSILRMQAIGAIQNFLSHHFLRGSCKILNTAACSFASERWRNRKGSQSTVRFVFRIRIRREKKKILPTLLPFGCVLVQYQYHRLLVVAWRALPYCCEATMSEDKIIRAPCPSLANRLPASILCAIFEYFDRKDIATCMRVCRHWWRVLEYEDSYVWELLIHRYLPREAFLEKAPPWQTLPFKQQLRAFMFAWNPFDSSEHCFVRLNGFTLCRHCTPQSTDGIRGKIGVDSGIHAWEFVWEGPLGTAACIGVATQYAPLHCDGYIPLLGSDDQGWSWNMVDNVLLHNNEKTGAYPHVNSSQNNQVSGKLRMILDCDQHVLYFEENNNFLGIAFNHLPPVKLFPAISAVYGRTQVTMVYIGQPVTGFNGDGQVLPFFHLDEKYQPTLQS